MDHLEGFALEGLRTLMVGVKDFSDEEFEAWDEVLICLSGYLSFRIYLCHPSFRLGCSCFGGNALLWFWFSMRHVCF